MKKVITSIGNRLALHLLATAAGSAFLMGSSDYASAAWPGSDGQIVFVGSQIAGESQEAVGLRSFSFGSSGPANQLTSEKGDHAPQVSPNGLLIAFARIVGTDGSAIFVMNRDGGDVRQLTNPGETESDGEPAFDAAGTHLMFVRSTLTASHIYSIDLGGQQLRQVTSGIGFDRSPAMSPSGRQIAFVRADFVKRGKRSKASHIFSMRPNGSRLRDLTPQIGAEIPVSGPDFSPDSRQITFATGIFTDSDIYLMGANGSHMRPITGLHRDQYGYSQPVFAPSGRSILGVSSNAYRTVLARVMIRKTGPKVYDMGAYRGVSPVWGPES